MAQSLGPILVTGGCGFIGYHLVKGLLILEPQSAIHVIDIDITRNVHPRVTYHKCDITNATDVEAIFLEARPMTIFHVACPDSTVSNLVSSDMSTWTSGRCEEPSCVSKKAWDSPSLCQYVHFLYYP